MAKVYLLDYVAGNIRSLVNAIERCGYEVEWIRSPEDVQSADVCLYQFSIPTICSSLFYAMLGIRAPAPVRSYHALDDIYHMLSMSNSSSHQLSLTFLFRTETHPSRSRSLRSLPLQSGDIWFPSSNQDAYCSRQALFRYLCWPAGSLCRLYGGTGHCWPRPDTDYSPALQLQHCQRRPEERAVHWLELCYNGP